MFIALALLGYEDLELVGDEHWLAVALAVAQAPVTLAGWAVALAVAQTLVTLVVWAAARAVAHATVTLAAWTRALAMAQATVTLAAWALALGFRGGLGAGTSRGTSNCYIGGGHDVGTGTRSGKGCIDIGVDPGFGAPSTTPPKQYHA